MKRRGRHGFAARLIAGALESSLLDSESSIRGPSLRPEVKRLVELFDQNRHGLEQEALLM